jgi:UDP-N-acetylmuramoylalanine--D-glutamate ligase
VALAVLDGLGVDVPGMKDELQAAVESFEGLPHRLAEIEDPSGLTFVDDTLSTSPYSAMHAIEAYASRPLTVLVGGTDRGLDYGPLREFLADRELTVIGIPDSGPRILEALSGLAGVKTENAEDLPAAVRLAREVTPAGGVVLLSPAAPSYGRYRNFEHRSEAFTEAIRESA